MSDLVVMKNLTVCLMELETSLEKSCMIDKNEATTYLVVMDMLGAVQSLETSHAIGASELDDWVEVVLRVVIRGEGTRHAIGASELVVCSPVIAAADELCDGIKLFALEVTVVEVLRGSIYMWDMGKIKAKQRFNVIMWWGPGRGHPEIKYPGLRGSPLGCQYLRLFYRQWLSVVSIKMGVQGIFRSKVGQNVVMYQLVWVVKVARQGTRRRLRLATWRSTRCTSGGTTRTGRSSSPLPRCSTRSPSVVVCLLLEAAYYAVIGQKNRRKAGLQVGLSRG